MSWDDDELANPVGIRLREIELPPGFDMQRALIVGRRSKRRRQRIVALAAAVAVTGAIGVAAVALRHENPHPQPLQFPAPVVVDAVAPLRPAYHEICSVTPLEGPPGMTVGGLIVDPTGRFIVSTAWRPNGPMFPILYRDNAYTRLDETKQWIAVNSSGVVVGIDPPNRDGRPRGAYVQRDGVMHRLAVPAGFTMAVPTAINDQGDVFGTLLHDNGMDRDGFSDIGVRYDLRTIETRGLRVAVWPAGAPDSPRLLGVPASAEAEAVGFGSSGLMVGNLHHDPGYNETPYAWDPTGARGPLPLPDGWAGFTVEIVRGDFVIGQIMPPNYIPDPSLVPNVTQSVNLVRGGWARWNTRTGKVEVFSRETTVWAANAAGWLLLTGSSPDYPTVLVAPDGTSRLLWGLEHVRWISDDGKRLVGYATQGDGHLGRWTCP